MQSVKFWGPKIWIQIPIEIRESKTIHLFNKRIKPHLIQNKIILQIVVFDAQTI